MQQQASVLQGTQILCTNKSVSTYLQTMKKIYGNGRHTLENKFYRTVN
jgi:hypothetical protein